MFSSFEIVNTGQNKPVARYYLENAWPTATADPLMQEWEITYEAIQR